MSGARLGALHLRRAGIVRMVVTSRPPQKVGTTQLSQPPKPGAASLSGSPSVREPASVEETGLDLNFIADLILKVIYFNSLATAQMIADTLCLPFFNIVDRALVLLKREEMIEVAGSNGFGELAYQYLVTPKGSSRAHDLIERSAYVGP